MNENIAEIVIPKANDKLYGYMSNDSKHGFTIKDGDTYTYWPTVTHYIEAKKFEGTQHETTIRKARTVNQVRVLSREREVLTTIDAEGGTHPTITKCKIYGNKKETIHSKTTWEHELEYHLSVALNHKFKQHTSISDMLLSTSPIPIVSYEGKVSILTAKVLMDIRKNLLK